MFATAEQVQSGRSASGHPCFFPDSDSLLLPKLVPVTANCSVQPSTEEIQSKPCATREPALAVHGTELRKLEPMANRMSESDERIASKVGNAAARASNLAQARG